MNRSASPPPRARVSPGAQLTEGRHRAASLQQQAAKHLLGGDPGETLLRAVQHGNVHLVERQCAAMRAALAPLELEEALTRCAHDGRPMIVCAMSHSEQHAVEICTALLSVQPPELRLADFGGIGGGLSLIHISEPTRPY